MRIRAAGRTPMAGGKASRGRAPRNRLRRSTDVRESLAQDDLVALRYGRLETHAVAAATTFDADGFTGVDRRREADAERQESRRIVTAHRSREQVADDTVRAEPVQDRSLEPCLACRD